MNSLESIPSAWKGHELFARWLVSFLQPKVTVELGVDFGYSTFILAEKNPGTVYGIDCFNGDEIIGQRCTLPFVQDFISKNQIKNIQLIKGYFDQVSQNWQLPIDILHIDGLHTYDAVKSDYLNYKNFLHENSVIMFHDTVSYPQDIGKFFNALNLPKVNFQHSYGLGVASLNQDTMRLIANIFDLVIY